MGFIKPSFDSMQFSTRFTRLEDRGHIHYGEIKKMRINVFKNTIEICGYGDYMTESGNTVILPDSSRMRRGSKLYSESFDVSHIPTVNEETVIEVKNIDCLDEGVELKKEGYNPAVLNMANSRHPGGGVWQGAGAQEETIFRRTNIYQSLYQFVPFAEDFGLEVRAHEQYPMNPNFGGIYTPGAVLFREGEPTYKLMEEPVQLSFISVAGVNRPSLRLPDHMTDEMAEITKNKIRTILRIGLVNGHNSLVLGALGCGSFCNPPSQVASLFHQVFEEPEFKNKYRKICFAIIDDRNAHKVHNPVGNLIPFQREFETQ